MLSEKLKFINLKEILINRKELKMFPVYENRKPWESIVEERKKYFLDEAVKYLDYSWPSINAVRYLDYTRNGNRSRYEDLCFERKSALRVLMIAECIEGKSRFIDEIINVSWMICEESSWVVPAHNNHYNKSSKPKALPDVSEGHDFVDLFSAETGCLLAFVCYLLRTPLDKESSLICTRIKSELYKRIIYPFMKVNDMVWMGFDGKPVNNWNPWIISNILTVVTLVEEDETARAAETEKCILAVDNFIKGYAPDGGCDEGPGYWEVAGAALFDCLELIYQITDGKFNVFDQELIKNIGRFIQRAHIADDYFVNFADSSPRLKCDYEMVSRYGRYINDEKLENFGKEMLNKHKFKDFGFYMSHRLLKNLLEANEITSGYTKQPPTAGDVWLEDIQFMACRENKDSFNGFFLAAKGGHNAESHNHNDIGNFIVYYDGKPILVDAGVESYTAKTFGPDRYDLWTMQSSYHNLPEINGFMQWDGADYRASDVSYFADKDTVKLSMNISGAYPKEAEILSWKRSIIMNRKSDVFLEIADEYSLKEPQNEIIFNLLVACNADISEAGKIIFYSGQNKVCLEYDKESLTAELEIIELTDRKIRSDWGLERLFRIRLNGVIKSVWGKAIMRIFRV